MLKKILCLALGLVLISAGSVISKEVLINPITPDIKDRIKESVKLVGDVDSSIAPKVKDLEKIYEMYKPCLQSPDDRGCVQLKEQVGEKYKAVLDAIGESLPKMRKSIETTARKLGESIQKKTRTKDMKSLYSHVSEKAQAPKVRGPLSKKLSKLLEALGSSSKLSILELSLQTQGDMIAASETLEFLEGKISQLSLAVELGQEIPLINEEMAGVMKGVSDLFGYDIDFIPEVLPEEPKSEGGGYGWD
jgi:SMC interacting uncharacterized protein involved in chromosome segregation